MDGGKLGIKRIDHIAIATPEVGQALPFWEQLFGMTVTEPFERADRDFGAVELSIPGSDTGMELIAPLSDVSFVARFLDAPGSKYHHVTFEVHDLEAAAQALRDYGIEPFALRTSAEAWAKELFIHPRDTGGVLVQLFEPHQK